MKKILLILAILLLATGCKKEEPKKEDTKPVCYEKCIQGNYCRSYCEMNGE